MPLQHMPLTLSAGVHVSAGQPVKRQLAVRLCITAADAQMSEFSPGHWWTPSLLPGYQRPVSLVAAKDQ